MESIKNVARAASLFKFTAKAVNLACKAMLFRPYPRSEVLSHKTMALPLFPELTEEQQDYIVEKIKDFYQGK